MNQEFNFSTWNTRLGWVVFAIALITYTLTVEPTMSFWDCGEYIATSAKLEVGHPPGAPLFQMLGAFFALFAPSADKIALMVNMLSVFSSAFTILFFYWSSNIVLRKVVSGYTEFTTAKAKAVLGSSLVGALAFTFSDSFWFNATEAEVYAMASFFIALLFWLGLRWEQEMNTPRGDRWLLLISFMIGLTFGVHFMALLCIPSIGFLYFFKNYEKVTIKNFIFANVVIVAILLFIFKLLLPYTLAFFGKSEIFMVNSMGLPFNSGTVIAFAAIVAFFIAALKFAKNKNWPLFHTTILSVLFLFIGFSTWLMLPVRANANTPINENKPSDAAEVLAYYNREQYGVNPLFYGPQYTDTFAGLDAENPYLDKAPNYERDYKSGKYVIVNNYLKAEQNTDDNHKAILPRLWSTEHIDNYINFTHAPTFRLNPNYDYEEDLAQYGVDLEKLDDEQITGAIAQLQQEMEKTVNAFKSGYAKHDFDNEDLVSFLKKYGDYLIVDKPTTFDNLSFMVEYQFGYMYGRYLLWNFVGRQNDVQGKYDNLDGNWISGIPFVDEIHLGKGTEQQLPDDVAKNKGRNTYFFIPFFLGLMGFFFHYQRDKKTFYILLILFLFTGLALKVYLNERPFEPRERDYALVGSFYIFAMWLGYGVFALYEKIAEKIEPKKALIGTMSFAMLGAPVLMAYQNWDDHDRSDRYTAVAMAKNYLDSCDKNAILFTIGDNDTFPLWYVQEVENYRTDVKIVNTSLLMTDWYIDQMKCKTHLAEGIPISFTHNQYVGDKLDYSAFIERSEERIDIHKFLEFISSKDERTLVALQNDQKIHFYPTNKIRIPVNKAEVMSHKVVSAAKYDSIVPFIDVDIKGSALYKNRLIMLDVVANNQWKRPIYFTGGSFGDDDYLWMKDYLQLDGMVYKLVPIKTKVDEESLDMGGIDADKMLQIVRKWGWGNGDKTTIYHDPETRKNSISYRTNLARLMEELINQKRYKEANEVMTMALEKMPLDYYGFYTMVDPFVEGYYEMGQTEKARKLSLQLIDKYRQELRYFAGIDHDIQNGIVTDIVSAIERYRSILIIAKDRKDTAFYNEQRKIFNGYLVSFKRFGRERE
ncbi:MAG: hypothetical protein CFE24_11085 [Flavobacterium sp. BFFFF2]|nr:MAG: hypothetical protein CFE24_11085 [Flavobacterium sp. BFFFF2]